MMRGLIASADVNSSQQLKALLEQTGLVGEVHEWRVVGEDLPGAGDCNVDIVLLDLGRDPDPYFALARHIRVLQPAVRVIACSNRNEPDPQLLLDAMRSGVQEFLAKPILADDLRAILQRFVSESSAPEKRATERLIVVMGAKGGVGTTTIAVNLAVQLASSLKKNTVLLDFGRPLGQCHLMLNLTPRFSIRDAVENLSRLDGHFFSGLLTDHRSGLKLLGGITQPEEWERISLGTTTRVINVAQSSFDAIVVDYGTQFSTEWVPVLRSARAVALVAETNVPALWALERHLLALLGMGVDTSRVQILINRWRRVDQEALKTVEKNIKHPISAVIPNDYKQVSDAINMGTPLSGNHNNPLVSKFAQLAAELTGGPGEPVRKETKPGGFNLFLFPSKKG
jgi:pilus assembly protein CpaE